LAQIEEEFFLEDNLFINQMEGKIMKQIINKFLTLLICFFVASNLQLLKAVPDNIEEDATITQHEEKDPSDNCSICLTSLYFQTDDAGNLIYDDNNKPVLRPDSQITTLPCGEICHKFHTTCFQRWLTSGRTAAITCPECRRHHHIPIPQTATTQQAQHDLEIIYNYIDVDGLRRINLRINRIAGFVTAKNFLQNLQQQEHKIDLLLETAEEITEIPEDFFVGLEHLEHLNIGYTDLEFLPCSIGSLTNLKKLRLPHNRLTSLPPEIGWLRNLQKLDLSYNQLPTLPVEIVNLSSLKWLDLKNNQLTFLPEVIGNLINLQELSLNHNQLIPWPTEIFQPFLSKTTPTEITGEYSQIIQTQNTIIKQQGEHNICCGVLTQQGFDEVKNYLQMHREVVILSLKLTDETRQIPRNFFEDLNHLENLYLYDNQLTELPRSIWLLTNLRELYLYENQLAELPTEIGNLTSLKKLSLYSNQLTDLPVEIVNLTSLQKLILSNNLFDTFPDIIGRIRSLKILAFDNNYIATLPDTIERLTNLEELHLNDNQLNALPERIGKLRSLKKLWINRNFFTSWPSEIELLQSLTYLDISENQLTTLPESIERLRNLDWLEVLLNPLDVRGELELLIRRLQQRAFVHY
jgi:Leucine-rich repeat (LRR) protein